MKITLDDYPLILKTINYLHNKKKNIIKNYRYWKKMCLPIYKIKIFHPKTVFYIFTPEHGNLGDQAIAVSSVNMFNEIGLKYSEYSQNYIENLAKHGKAGIFNRRKIIFNGGGYLGTLWPKYEKLTREIIVSNPKSKILFLPNTVYYENNEEGSKEKNESALIYNANKNIKLLTRENTSYELARSIYKNVELIPDMALYLKRVDTIKERKGCIFCVRSDSEKTMNDNDFSDIQVKVKSIFNNNISFLDTSKPYGIKTGTRYTEVYNFINELSKAELIITDRLHGMILSAIAGTPCIVLNSKSHKVKGCYEWIKQLGYIKFCDNPEKLIEIYNSIPQIEYYYNNSHLALYYDRLKEIIKEL